MAKFKRKGKFHSTIKDNRPFFPMGNQENNIWMFCFQYETMLTSWINDAWKILVGEKLEK